MKSATGKTTDLRDELNYLRKHPEIMSEDPELSAYRAVIEFVKGIYAGEETIARTAKRLKIGKRTLERAMKSHPDLSAAIDAVRASVGR